MRKYLRKVLFFLLIAGISLWILDEIYRRINRSDFDYMDISLIKDGQYRSKTLRGKEKRKVIELFLSLAREGKTVWINTPMGMKCPLTAWDNWNERMYYLCRDKEGNWYVGLPGSSGGMSTVRYFRIKEESAKRLIELTEP